MIVLSVGMPKAGSGWYFNLTNDLLVAAGQSDVREVRQRFRLGRVLKYDNCNMDPPRPGKWLLLMAPVLAGHTFVVKSHREPRGATRALMTAGALGATYIYRDPRDVLVSAMEHGTRGRARGATDAFAKLENVDRAIEALVQWLDVAEAWLARDDVLHVRYEDLKLDPEREAERLKRHLGLEVNGKETARILQRYSSANPEAADRLHFNKGVAGRFREVLSDHEVDQLRDRVGPRVEALGYSW